MKMMKMLLISVRPGAAGPVCGPGGGDRLGAAVRPLGGRLRPVLPSAVCEEQRPPQQPVSAAAGLRLPGRPRGTTHLALS